MNNLPQLDPAQGYGGRVVSVLPLFCDVDQREVLAIMK
jgi:hypothetical protein